jgi:hypothetical protein
MRMLARILLCAFLPLLAAGEVQAGAKQRHSSNHHDEKSVIVMQVGSKNDPLRALNDKIKQDIAGKVIQDVQNQTGPSSNALQQFADFITGDVANAADLAISIPDTLDGNGQICFDAMKGAGKIFQENPMPTGADVKQGLASAFERIRLLSMTARKICDMSACTQMSADANGALSALAPIKIPIPNLHDICNFIPNIAVAAPTRTLPATPAAVPSPTPSPGPTP